jgi:hypothetical protein
MTRGVLLFAHNNREVDYALLSIIAGSLAKKFLDVPVSLITDRETKDWMKESGIIDRAEAVFDKIILTPRVVTDNTRKLNDGVESKLVPFINSTRCLAYDLTPYDRTLLIDSDFLILSNRLASYWDHPASVMVGESINDIVGNRIGYLDKTVSETGPKLYWATTVMFSKDQEAKLFFDALKTVNQEYEVFADLYRYGTKQFRNDISFSIVKHIMDGFSTDTTTCLPPLLTVQDKDMLIKVSGTQLHFLLNSNQVPDTYFVGAIKDTDVHIMNKQSIIRNGIDLLELL